VVFEFRDGLPPGLEDRRPVVGGALSLWVAEGEDRGMVGFADELNKEDVEALRAYVIHRAHETLAENKAAKK
jgi:hypothetical protein